jgi:hypothetical protein
MRAAAHLFHLLKLFEGENGGELIVRGFLERAHLQASVLLGKLAVVVDGLDLLLPVGKDGFELGGLVRGQVETTGKVLSLTLRIGLVMVHRRPLRGVLRWRGCLLRQSGASAEGKNECCGEERTFHRSGSLCAAESCRVCMDKHGTR